MGRVLLVVLVLGILVIGGGIAYFGAFPPEPKVVPVSKVLPIEQFKPAG